MAKGKPEKKVKVKSVPMISTKDRQWLMGLINAALRKAEKKAKPERR